jgi:hypothetical protein
VNNIENVINNWLTKTIIGLNLCPFAKRPYDNNGIRTNSCSKKDEESQIKFFLDELSFLQSTPGLSTSLLEDLIDQLNLTDEFQLVCFHPKFIFENTHTDERVNYVNRSPYPLVHIIRSVDIQNALSSPQEGEQISFNNEKTLNSLTDAQFLQHFPSTFYS